MNKEQLGRHQLAMIPDPLRNGVRSALGSAIDDATHVALEPLHGGASGALVHRVRVEGTSDLLLRIETARDGFRDPHRTYPCLQSAAHAGIAPGVHVADADQGIVVMDFVEQRPLDQHPGGIVGAVAELGRRTAELQATAPFPVLDDFLAVLGTMLAMIDAAGVFVTGVLDPLHDAFARVAEQYPWDRATEVSSHNDVNPQNVLFDGERLWLVDWELAFRNDPFADIAGIANNFIEPLGPTVDTAQLEAALLSAWLGRAATDTERSRFDVMRQVNRLFYGCLLVSVTAGQLPPEHDLDAPPPDEFRADVESGRLTLGSPELLHVFGKMHLAGFLAGVSAPGFGETLEHARSG